MKINRKTVGWRLSPELMAEVAEYGRQTGRSGTRAAEMLLRAALKAGEVRGEYRPPTA